jgi:hypothetical protein
MRNCVLVFLLCSFIFTQGCCSIFCSGHQSVSVNSKSAGVEIRIGEYKGTTPCTLQVPRGRDYVLQATYNGKIETHTLKRSIEPLYWGNMLIFPGLIVDFATGAMWQYNPEFYYVSL